AAKFSSKGDEVQVAVLRREQTFRIEIRDHGEGIPEEFRARIFQKFSQADSSDSRQKGGTGLGLSISKALVESMGGELDFTSVYGHGTTFYCTFPVCQGQPEQPVAAWAAQYTAGVSTPLAPPLVLVCDPDPAVCATAQTLLEREGYRVLPVTAGDAVLDAIRQQPAVILLSLYTHDITIWESLLTLKGRSTTPDIPIVLFSTSTAETEPRSTDLTQWVCHLESPSLLRALDQVLGARSL
ncbi:MAG: hypothetical protein FJZ47_26015, partial [Candidatus Tectomicrobia bacterium]|nr:hypothetical protein [Candidatus Tectomicrobia bacterium]